MEKEWLAAAARLMLAGVPLLCACVSPLAGKEPPLIVALERVETSQVCILVNRSVRREEFLAMIEKGLRARGYEVLKLPESAPFNACPVVATYDASWTRFDDVLWRAVIHVYVGGHPVGAVYFHWRFNYPSDDATVLTWVNRLFPPASRAPAARSAS